MCVCETVYVYVYVRVYVCVCTDLRIKRRSSPVNEACVAVCCSVLQCVVAVCCSVWDGSQN